MFADCLILIDLLYDLPKSFVVIVQVFTVKTTTGLKSSARATYPPYALTFKLNNDYKTCQAQKGHCLLAFLSVEMKRSEIMRDANTRRPENLVYGYSTAMS